MPGSSPRMRGKQVLFGFQRAGIRIIPAHAGQTYTRDGSSFPPPDHPRACGANLVAASPLLLVGGSSPRMRGKPAEAVGEDDAERIIPAHAGQTWLYRRMVSSSPDHPRACGANCGNLPRIAATSGSSPRMRGKRIFRCGLLCVCRIIPAHAGQTLRWLSGSLRSPDHPRACGANTRGGYLSNPLVGSSPRMRGKLTSRQESY